MNKQTYYNLKVGNLNRKLPYIPIGDNLAIASFVLLGDAELAHHAAELLIPHLPDTFDHIVTFESKGIPLAQELTYLSHRKKYFVLRKSIKTYMKNPITYNVNSITTEEEQLLVLDGNDAEQLKNKKIILLDDVVSTGGSLKSATQLFATLNIEVVGNFAILAEGDAANRSDLIYLSKLPLFKYPSLEEI